MPELSPFLIGDAVCGIADDADEDTGMGSRRRGGCFGEEFSTSPVPLLLIGGGNPLDLVAVALLAPLPLPLLLLVAGNDGGGRDGGAATTDIIDPPSLLVDLSFFVTRCGPDLLSSCVGPLT